MTFSFRPPDDVRPRGGSPASLAPSNGDRRGDAPASPAMLADMPPGAFRSDARPPRADASAGGAQRAEHEISLDGAAFVRVLDCLTEGVVLVKEGGIVYRNAAAARLLASEGDALAADVQLLVRRALRSARVAEMARASAATGSRFQLRATNLAADDLVAMPLVVVTIERTSSTMPSRAVTMRQFNLTAREASVALLVAQGRSNAEVAAALHISESTARHYTESVFLKLGVHTRAAAAAAILGTEQRRGRERRG
jgi:DNA-binding CsgD family transcriptional regulator